MQGIITPAFGARVVNVVAGDSNPRKYGFFVRVKYIHSRMNNGTWWECTDGHGDFWYSNPEHIREVPL